jgi:hypothetical protein
MDELAKQIASLAEKFGPNVMDAAFGAVRMNAYSILVAGTFSIVIGAALAFAGIWLASKTWSDDWNEIKWLPASLLLAAAFCFILTGGWAWVNPWTWTAINHPELWLAKDALHF